ncbi:DUF294 nucleotidyltransferase-like domain-containing protein [Stappia sp.]|uniref:DUF294 nucleotidyltransferase-like domain-containing protein n=1 Tax=Stappia sp. TaxID=1870903 RepID=UPI003A98D836
MTSDTATFSSPDKCRFFERHHPFDLLPMRELEALAAAATPRDIPPGTQLFAAGETVTALYAVETGEVDLTSAEGALISRCLSGEGFGARSLMRNGIAQLTATATTPTRVLVIPAACFHDLAARYPAFAAYFDRMRDVGHRRIAAQAEGAAAEISVDLRELMTTTPVIVPTDMSARAAAGIMAEKSISCVLVGTAERLAGILTSGDLTARVLAAGRDPLVPVSAVMTPDPAALPPSATMFDALLVMSGRGIGHLPVVEDGRPVGIVTRTNLVSRQSLSAAALVADIARLTDIDALAAVVGRVPQLLAQLVGLGVEAYRIGHLVTSVTDALTRRLIALAEARLGAAPVPYLWLACGSQGRREQTGVSDQDNCLILDDAFDPARHDGWFAEFARLVSEGLDACGYFFCPGDMMATNPRWRQPASVWRDYFAGWIARPDPMAQMLASVMFDLRPIHGDTALFAGMQATTLEAARRNSIFRAHMAANSLKHTPPLGLFRGFALIRGGEHKDTLDLKHSGVVPVVDLARLYALTGALSPVNTRERLFAARDAGVLSQSGGSDLIDAYDLICNIRLAHQARQVREGGKPDNFMAPSTLSALERNHLKDAFGVIKTLQSAIGHGNQMV